MARVILSADNLRWVAIHVMSRVMFPSLSDQLQFPNWDTRATV